MNVKIKIPLDTQGCKFFLMLSSSILAVACTACWGYTLGLSDLPKSSFITITEVETIIAIVTLIHRDIIYPLAIIYNVWVAIITLYVGIISQIICLQLATYKSLLNPDGPLIPFFRGCCSTTNGNRKEIMKHGLFHAFHAHLSTVLVNSYYHGYYIYFLEIVCYSQKCKIYCLVFSDISVWVDPKIHTTACFMIMYTNCKYFQFLISMLCIRWQGFFPRYGFAWLWLI